MDELIKQATGLLQCGRVISFPTETVYALACDATNEQAVARIYEIKGRDFNKPLALFAKDIASLEGLVELNENARKLAAAFCPGPITFVLPKSAKCAFNPKLSTLAVRIPDNAISMQILNAINFPIVATSANPSGQPEAVNAAQVKEYFGNMLELVIDGGDCRIGKASTIVDLCGDKPVILREGEISAKQIMEIIN